MIARGNRTGEAKVGEFMISLFVLDFAHAILWSGVHCQAAVLDAYEGARDKTVQGNL